MSASSQFKKALGFIIENKLLTKTEIHNKTGIARISIDRYLSGDQVPGLDHAEKIALACGYSLAQWLGNAGSDHPIEECMRRVTIAALKGSQDRQPQVPKSEAEQAEMIRVETTRFVEELMGGQTAKKKKD